MWSRALLVAAAVAALPVTAGAKPSADLVIVWAPGARIAPLAAAARDAGAALLDRSPAARAANTTSATIARAITEFDALRFPDATRLLDDAKAEADRTGAADVPQSVLSDLFLYRARLASERGDAPAAWDALTTAVIVAPTRVIDPARFAPSVRAELDRAKATIASRPKAVLAIDAPPSCSVRIDGAPAAQTPYYVGSHWVNVACPDREPWGTRVELVGADMRITAGNAPIAPPTDDELLIQARTAAAAAFVSVRVHNGLAQLRLVGADGRERDRRTVRIERGELAPAANALTALLAAEATVARRWYHSPVLWTAVGAAIATAIVLPIALTAESSPNPVIRPTGTTW